MEHRLVFSKELEAKLNSVATDTKTFWLSKGIRTYHDLMSAAVSHLNETYAKLNITSYAFEDNVIVFQQTNTYFGLIKKEDETILAYVFVIPPKYETRSGILAQQVFPVLSGIIPKLKHSNERRITNRPIFIINMNESKLTKAMAVNIKSGEILKFRYVDPFDRDINAILVDNKISPIIHTILDYDKMLQNVNKNEFFSINIVDKIITFLPTRLKDGIHVNNEPYWFVLKAYAALYLSKREGYHCDMSQINTLSRGNKTLNAFRDFVERVEN